MSQKLNQKSETRNQKQIRNSNFIFRASYFVFRILLVCFVFLISNFVFIAISQPASAQSTTLAVSPPVVEILLASGKKLEQTFTLQTGGKNLEITPELHLATPADSSGHMIIDPNPLNPSSIPLTLTLSPPIHDLQSTIYNLTIEAPNTATTQDIYLALVFHASTQNLTLNDDNLQPTPAISSLLLITINPADSLPIELTLEDFPLPSIHDSWTPLTISPTLKNNTDIMIRPQGKYEVIAPSGKTVFSVPLYPHLILGNSTRRILGSHTRCEGLPHTGCVDPASPLSFTPHWSNLGPHRLRLTITSESGTQLTQAEKTIWILPLRFTLLTLVILALLASFVLTRQKTRLKYPLDTGSQTL